MSCSSSSNEEDYSELETVDISGLISSGQTKKLARIFCTLADSDYDYEIAPGLTDVPLITRSREIYEESVGDADHYVYRWVDPYQVIGSYSRGEITPEQVNVCLYFLNRCDYEAGIAEVIYLTARRELVEALHKIEDIRRERRGTGALMPDNYTWLPEVMSSSGEIIAENICGGDYEGLSMAVDFSGLYDHDTSLESKLDLFLFLASYQDKMDCFIVDEMFEEITGLSCASDIPSDYPRLQEILAELA